MRWGWVLSLVVISSIAYAGFSFGTFYSRTYARIPASGSAEFHFYVINPGTSGFVVRVSSPSGNFYVTAYPSDFDPSSCSDAGWIYYGGRYVKACKVRVRIVPKDGIVNGRYTVPVTVEAIPQTGGQGFQAKIAQVRQINYEIDIYGGKLFLPPSPVEALKPIVSRIGFSSMPSGSPAPAQQATQNGNSIHFGSAQQPNNSPIPEPPASVSDITGYAVQKASSSKWYMIAGIVAVIVLIIVLRLVL